MIKMFKGEVLGKLPVMQHFLFGSILPYEGPPPPEDVKTDAHGHAHTGTKSGWGDCCGIPIPSAFAEAQKKKEPARGLSGPGIRPVPFD
jgi:serine/threonine-protein phosphatase 2A activator